MITVTDTVKNPDGSPMSGATFTLKQTIYVCGVPTSATQSVVTDEGGVYSIDLECGVYTLKVGFKGIRLEQNLGNITINGDIPSPTSFEQLIGQQIPPPLPIIEELRRLEKEAAESAIAAKLSEVSAKNSAESASGELEKITVIADGVSTDADNVSNNADAVRLVGEQVSNDKEEVVRVAGEVVTDADVAKNASLNASASLVEVTELVATATDKASDSEKSAIASKNSADTSSNNAIATNADKSAVEVMRDDVNEKHSIVIAKAETVAINAEAVDSNTKIAIENAKESEVSAQNAKLSADIASDYLKLPMVWCPLDNKLSMLAGIGEPTQLDIAGAKYDIPETHNVKFSRTTSAWLDGVEYPVNTPRYTKEGRLLIESQNTNYMTVPFPYDTLAFKKSDPLTTATVTAVDGWSDYSVALASGHGIFDISGGVTLYNTLMSMQLTVKKTEDYNFKLQCFNNHGGGSWAYEFIANQPHPTADNLIIVDNGDSFTITASEHFEDSGYKIFRVFPNIVANSTRSLVFKDLMTILGGKPTSYIPTNGIAVTRAADVCLINGINQVTRWENEGKEVAINKNSDGYYQLPPNSYRDLKGFKL